MAWKIFFKLVEGAPKRFRHGDITVNLNNPAFSLHKLKKVYQDGCKYIILTDRGREKFPELLSFNKLPNTLSKELKKRNIEKVDLSKLGIDLGFDDSGSGASESDDSLSGAAEVLSEKVNIPQGNLNAEEIINKALDKGIVTKKGNSIMFNDLRFGAKAILTNLEVIKEIAALV